jgi:hypothetical protein
LAGSRGETLERSVLPGDAAGVDGATAGGGVDAVGVEAVRLGAGAAASGRSAARGFSAAGRVASSRVAAGRAGSTAGSVFTAPVSVLVAPAFGTVAAGVLEEEPRGAVGSQT